MLENVFENLKISLEKIGIIKKRPLLSSNPAFTDIQRKIIQNNSFYGNDTSNRVDIPEYSHKDLNIVNNVSGDADSLFWIVGGLCIFIGIFFAIVIIGRVVKAIKRLQVKRNPAKFDVSETYEKSDSILTNEQESLVSIRKHIK